MSKIAISGDDIPIWDDDRTTFKKNQTLVFAKALRCDPTTVGGLLGDIADDESYRLLTKSSQSFVAVSRPSGDRPVLPVPAVGETDTKYAARIAIAKAFISEYDAQLTLFLDRAERLREFDDTIIVGCLGPLPRSSVTVDDSISWSVRDKWAVIQGKYGTCSSAELEVLAPT